MTAFAIYASIIIILIYTNRFFGLFNDDKLSPKLLSLVFLLKVLAVPAFYLFFKIAYGGIDNLDAGKFYADAKVMNNLAYVNFTEYIKMLVGLQDDTPGSFFSKTCIEPSMNWDNGKIRDFFYNDNRVVIRFHSIVHFIAFNSYFVHALVGCFLSFIGFFFLYRSFKQFFIGKEQWLLIIICLFPTLWLYTGGLLKEGPVIFILGLLLFRIKKLWDGNNQTTHYVFLLILVFISLLLKPYILLFATTYYLIFFALGRMFPKKATLTLLLSIAVVAVSANYLSLFVKGKTLVEAAQKREAEFADLAEGGIFLLDSVKFVRLKYDSNLVKRVLGRKDYFTIRKKVSYIYWEHQHQQDTLFCHANTDTTTQFSLVYILPKAGSTINVIRYSKNGLVTVGRALYFSLCHPMFFNAKGALQYLASFENLMLVVSLIIVIAGSLFNKAPYPALAMAIFGLCIFLIVGFTTPNSGAILRYRAPAAIFILMAALYFIKPRESKPHAE